MEFLVLDTNLEAVAVLDTFESVIWTDRYFACGDFEIYSPVSGLSLALLTEDYYLWLEGSDHVMIIEDRQIASDAENGGKLTVTGRSLESILERRIIWAQTVLTGNLQNGIKKLLDENIILATIVNRRVSNLVFEASIDPIVTALTIESQYDGENLYEAIRALCEQNNIGFKITLNDSGQFVFKLYAGVNRSYDQIANPYVVFSPEFENLINSNYVESKKTLKTVSLVVGEGEGAARTRVAAEVSAGAGAGLTRREMFTDAGDISATVDSVALAAEVYAAQLTQRGTEELAENIFVSSFEGQIDDSRMFTYGKDFFMGDIVQIANEYGLESKSRVIEVVRSQSASGIDVHPTFSTVE